MTDDAMLDAIIHEVMQVEAEEEASVALEDGLRAILSRFAADLIDAVLPVDPIAQQAVIRKAQALGIDVGAQSGENVVHLADHIRTKAGLTSDQLAALNEIGEHLDDLIMEARAAKLDALAASLEGIRPKASQ
jgi:hypothetical protein